MDQEKILSRKAASEFLGICLTTLSRLDIPKIKVRKRILFRQSELIRWLKEREREPVQS